MHHFYIYEVVIAPKWGLEIERKITTSAVEAFSFRQQRSARGYLSYAAAVVIVGVVNL